MPDPVSNAEIEDVLTSIRRLVSENRPIDTASAMEESAAEDAYSEPEQAPEEPTQNAPMALVLTPALRVEDTAEYEAQDGDHEGEEDEASESMDVGALESDEDAPFDLNQEDDGETDVFDAELRDTASEDTFDSVHEESDTAADYDEGSVDAQDEGPHELSSDDWAADGLEDDALSDSDEWGRSEPAEMVEVEQEAEAAAEAESEGGEEAGFVEVQEEFEDEPEEPFDFKKVLEARLVNWRDDAVQDTQADAPEVMDEAAAEDSVAPVLDSAAPGQRDSAEALEPLIEAQVYEDTVDAASAAVEVGLADALDEPAVIDEDALREMVSDIVRQELQGALGERITRNVRKLVRREIHRALAAHDLD